MSRQQDLLFCKIAVANGMVTEEQAKKALALVNQREQESGRRPLIGAVFSKYKLLRQDQVQVLYDAVQKRLGSAAAPAGAMRRPSAGKRGSRGDARAAAPQRARPERRPARKVDPKTFWMGIGFGVVFVGAVVALAVMLWPSSDSGSPEVAESGKASSRPPGGASGPAGAGAPDGAGAAAGGLETIPGESGAAPMAAAMDPAQRSKILQWLHDARRESFTNSERALEMVENLLAEIRTKRVPVEPALMAEIEAEHQRFRQEVQGQSATGTGEAPVDPLGGLEGI